MLCCCWRRACDDKCSVPKADTSIVAAENSGSGSGLSIEDVIDLSTEPDQMTTEQKELLEKDPDGKLRDYRDFAQRLVQEQVKLVEEADTTSATAQQIAESPAGKLRGEKGSYVVFMYQPAMAGEPVTYPHIRIAPLRHEHLCKMTRAAVLSRNTEGDYTLKDGMEIHDGDAYVFCDGCRHGNEASLMAGFRDASSKMINKQRHQLFIAYDEDSLRERRERTRTSLDQVEYGHIVTAATIQIDDRPRLELPGTTLGNLLGPVGLPPHEAMWRLTFAEKKVIYASNRIDVGGPTPGINGKHNARDNSDLEPVAFHGQSKAMYAELGHMLKAKAFVNLTNADDVLAEHCVENKIPYLGVVFNVAHRQALLKRLVSRVFVLMQEESSPLFQPGLVKLLGKKLTEKAKAKGKASAKDKSKSKTASAKQKDDANTKKKNKKDTSTKPTKPAAAAKGAKGKLLDKLKAMQNGAAADEEDVPTTESDEESEANLVDDST